MIDTLITASAQSLDAPSTGAQLQPVSATAARELARLAAREHRSRAMGVLAQLGLRLRHLGSEEAAKSGLRYQPVIWTVIAVVAIAALFPGRQHERPLDSELANSPTGALPLAPPATVAAGPTQPTPGVPEFEIAYLPPTPPAPVFTPPTPAPSAPPTTVSAPALVALKVRGFGWASSLAGTGISSSSVPEGTMPVGARLGQLDKVSFLRLSGTASTLSLEENTAGAREALGPGAVRACAIVDAGWAEEPDQSMTNAPQIDTEHCVDGVEDASTWTFDLSGFNDRSGQRGVALLPAAGAPADFQLTFRPS